MIDVSIVATKTQYMYRIPLVIGSSLISAKFDTGARSTVISVEMIREGLNDKHRQLITDFCENHCKSRKEFVSASGDSFVGYKIKANNVMIGESILNEFYYYLVIENKRSISLLGFDFIDACRYEHDPYGDVVIMKFDNSLYGEETEAVIENDDILSFIDEMEV